MNGQRRKSDRYPMCKAGLVTIVCVASTAGSIAEDPINMKRLPADWSITVACIRSGSDPAMYTLCINSRGSIDARVDSRNVKYERQVFIPVESAEAFTIQCLDVMRAFAPTREFEKGECSVEMRFRRGKRSERELRIRCDNRQSLASIKNFENLQHQGELLLPDFAKLPMTSAFHNDSWKSSDQ
jgi:hypothetical protein